LTMKSPSSRQLQAEESRHGEGDFIVNDGGDW